MSLTLGLVAAAILTWSCGNNQPKNEGEKPKEQQETTQTNAQEAVNKGLNASFKDIHGKTVSLANLKGKVVVMNFWATWCPPCIKELPSLQKLSTELANEKDIVFMAIEVDQDIEKAAQFMAKNKYTLPLFTLDSQLPEELASNSIPVTVILAKNGDIVGKQVGMMDFGSEKLKQGLIDLTKENNK